TTWLPAVSGVPTMACSTATCCSRMSRFSEPCFNPERIAATRLAEIAPRALSIRTACKPCGESAASGRCAQPAASSKSATRSTELLALEDQQEQAQGYAGNAHDHRHV